jgi:hypothetical protein
MNHTSSAALWTWLTSNTQNFTKDPCLPNSLCVVEPNPSSGWIVTGFISSDVEQYAVNWAMQEGARKSAELANLLQNRILRGGLKIFFEKWLFYQLGAGRILSITQSTGEKLECQYEKMKVISSSLHEMDENIIYKLDQANFPSIEGYSRFGSYLILLQSTVSESHSGARFKDVRDIVRATQQVVKDLNILVVYITPSNQEKIDLPLCVGGFPKRQTSVVRGTVDDSDFIQHSSSKKRGRSSESDGTAIDKSGGGSEQDKDPIQSKKHCT